ncbi:protein-S-isoprenylcysteine O-methyltransferase Ste14 [Neolewinella xylanilytica]|uniref:Protein-S-isoprenylcysteine O-methyltransferase Ste14 n=1 Tax=Neolewinella xylanilytica TaxID=1514080 RepID=A0A2S6IAH1_9BACT|nr:isoprenylcysteine carboxylmethyltransferase family protein [Neolewinella xylanilytica]PPK88501.1 protein-S-isoprenylcysteine O-methyltransferase Ste14 [Neolewinella xylanilytica]
MKSTAYLLQACLVVLWWLGMAINHALYWAFQFDGIGSTAFLAFFLPDVGVIVLCSVLRAYTARPALEYVILGGFGYASLYCLQATVMTASGYLPTALMLLGLAFNGWLIGGERTFRPSGTASLYVNVVKTLIQIGAVWTITLVGLPLLILEAFGNDMTVTLSPGTWFGGTLFVLASLLNLFSAYYLVSRGEGTPLPLDQTNRLVVSGPYRYLRNPMAVAGVAQGVAVGMLFHSPPVIAYALLGALLWQVTVRPAEEADMRKRFGRAYEEYVRHTPCWIPKIRH